MGSFSYVSNMLEIRGLHKSFSRAKQSEIFWALRDVNLNISKGEFMTWLGPSGCGKTTLLRCLAGLESPTEGDIQLHGKSLLTVSPQNRPFHMVFQRYALFPHMSVIENIEFPLRIRKTPDSQIQNRVKYLIEMMGLENFRHQKPDSLSGGQSQRVALARALANQPEVLLLDEPLSALDEKIRTHLRHELKELQRKVGITFIFVTHDQQEALQISDRIVVFHEGKIHQVGSPQEIYSKPQSDFVARFIGFKNEMPQSGFVYPEDVRIDQSGDHRLSGQIESLDFLGREFEVHVIVNQNYRWRVLVSPEKANKLQAGQTIALHFDNADIIRVPNS